MILNGYYSGDSKSVEIIDLKSDTSLCQNLPDFPLVTRGTFGGLIDGQVPIVCGGPDIVDCFKYEMGRWMDYFSMNEARMHFTGMVGSPYNSNNNNGSSHKFYIVGDSHNAEVLTDAGWKVVDTKVPKIFFTSCLVAINQTAFIIIVGQVVNGQNFSRDTYIFNSEQNLWAMGPPLTQARRASGCGLVPESADGGQSLFIVAGGENGGVSVELLNEVDGKWFDGNNVVVCLFTLDFLSPANGQRI